MENRKQRLPLWGVTLGVFGVLLAMVIAFFFWQSQRVKQAFLDHAQQHATLVSEIIRLNARGTLLTRQTIEDVLMRLLGNTARFVDYLDMLEPFSGEELSVFSRKNGLAGTSILGADGRFVQGPENWLAMEVVAPPSGVARMEHIPDKGLYVLTWPDASLKGCVVLGMADTEMVSLIEGVGLDNVIRAVSGVPGITRVTLEPLLQGDSADYGIPALNINDQGQAVVEARLAMDGKVLMVAVDAGHLKGSINQLWVHLGLFSLCLALTGLALSVLLHRYQTSIVKQARDYERELASQHEDAALGRAAAAIAHEIRNPLNALGMGLQRLELESTNLPQDHLALVRQMLAAVQRANSSVTGLLRYARPSRPGMKPVHLDRLVHDLLSPYVKHCQEIGISISSSVQYHEAVNADPELMGQVIENIVLNAIEAQPGGGFLEYSIVRQPERVGLIFRNSGCGVPPDQAHRILEPYFTTRPQGTGLGMAIVSRIVRAMNGQVQVAVDGSGIIEIRIWLPGRSYSGYGQPRD
ncbi:MAG: ATP-binding protein [Pseudomonadota bacterium]